MRIQFVGAILGCSFLVTTIAADAQSGQRPKQEFRGVWIATVANLDWPIRDAAPDQQKALLVLMLDRLKDAGINAVFFQVRSESDAMYDSPIEPWSYWLTGRQGRAPDPWYDPLAFAVDEAHKRGLELHAWFNPYRAYRGSGYTPSPLHVTQTHPEWLLWFGNIRVLDPGRAAVRDYVTGVVMDVVRRYDIDGVHFDDYFYPYPPNEISSEDAATFAEEGRGFSSLFEWRRDNVNIFIAQLADSIRHEKPAVKFGISPFGIWKNGVPQGIRGLDAYNVIYADATAWLAAETIDYLVPQLYWPFGGAQDYAKLAPWWVEQINGRHLYIGHGLYRADSRTFSSMLFAPEEIPEQVRFNRGFLDILGSVFFRARNITHFPSQGIVDAFKMDLYRHPALTPTMAWKVADVPGVPANLQLDWTGDTELTLSWDRVEGARRYAVYRVRSGTVPDFSAAAQDADHLLAVTGVPALVDNPGIASDPYYYFVQAVGGNSSESGPSSAVSAIGRATAVAVEEGIPRRHATNYPNPFRNETQLIFGVDETGPVALRIYNPLGQLLRTLADGKLSSPGTYGYQWDGTDNFGRKVGSGTYYFVVDSGGRRVTRSMALVR